MILLDTHVLLWLRSGDARLGVQSRARIDNALASDQLAVSAIAFWEVAMLRQRKRIELEPPVAAWRSALLREGLHELPISGEAGFAAAELRNFHSDPADRLMVATARLARAGLLTADERILSWTGRLRRYDARR